MSEIKIEKGIPIPIINENSKAIKSSMVKMEIGDSFVCSSNGKNLHVMANIVRISIATRKISATEYRVWRVA